MDTEELKQIMSNFNIMDNYDKFIEDQKTILNELENNEVVFSSALGITIEEYRKTYLLNQNNNEYSSNIARAYEDIYKLENAVTSENTYIQFNLNELNTFLNLGGDIKPIGKHTAQILEDRLYSGIPRISRDVVKIIIDYFKIIDIFDVHQKYNENQLDNYIDSDSEVDV